MFEVCQDFANGFIGSYLYFKLMSGNYHGFRTKVGTLNPILHLEGGIPIAKPISYGDVNGSLK